MGEKVLFQLKSANSTKIAKFAFWEAVSQRFRKWTILGGENVVLEQHSRPGA